MLKTLLISFALFLVPHFASAQSITLPGQTNDGMENWMLDVTDQVDDLVTNYSGALAELGAILLAYCIIVRLVAAVSRFHHHHIFLVQELWEVLVLSCITTLAMNYYSTPLPGTNVSLHQIPSYVARLVSGTFDMQLVTDFYTRFGDVLAFTQAPHAWDVVGILTYFIVQLIVLLMDGVLFVVNSWGFVGLGITTVFGPILIPTLVTKHFRGKFFTWLDLLVGFAMYRAVASAMTTVWAGVVLRFLNNTVNKDYTLAHWNVIAGALVLVSFGFIYGLLKVPTITERIFGGMGHMAEGFGNAVLSAARRAVA